MNESILKALLKLFAIIANVKDEQVSHSARNMVEAYLVQQLNKRLVNEYLNLFDEYLVYHHQIIHNRAGKKVRRNVSNSVKVLKICQQVNEALHQKEKIIVFIRLLEFVYEDGILSDEESDFIQTISDIFRISKVEFASIKSFIIDKGFEKIPHDRLLVIDNLSEFENADGVWFEQNKPKPIPDKENYKHIFNENLDGKIVILHIRSINFFVFRYLGKANLYLNSNNIIPRRFYVFNHGAIIRGHRITPIYYSDIAGKFLQGKEETKIFFTGEEVEFKFKVGDNGIHKFNFCEESGQLVGIMGGSGVGKSTLLNVLNGKLPLNNGKITINGYDLYKDKHRLEGVIGFVPQDDLLIEELTVFQNLYYNAKLCFNNFTEKQILRTIHGIMKDLELYEIRNLKVGNPLNKFISGGQRKRVNIALELMREPSILFVDEPTSGLSSMDSEMVMLLLKKQTLKGKLVIINIHQPSSDIFKLFDRLWIMDKGGRVIYKGNPIDALIYFKKMSGYVNADESECPTCGNVNPEQILQIVEARMVDEYGRFKRERRISPKDWYSMYRENIETPLEKKKKIEKKLPQNFFKVPEQFKQFKIFVIRNLLAKFTDKQYLLINFLEAPLLAIILGFFTKYIAGTPENPHAYVFSENQNLPAYLFMCVVVALFIGMMVSAEEIIKDRKILQRESFLNLSRFSYINSKIVIMFTISAIQMLTFVLIGNWILEIKGMNIYYWLVLFSTACFSNMVGLNISSGLKSIVTIYILIPFILVPQLLLSGVIVSYDKLHEKIASKEYVPVVGDLMISRWAYEALAVTQFKENKYQKYFYNYDQKMSNSAFKTAFILPKLENKLDYCEQILKDKEDRIYIEDNLQLISNEIEKIEKEINDKELFFHFKEQLNIEEIDTNIVDYAKDYLKILRIHYSAEYNRSIREKEQIIKDLIKEKGKDILVELKQKNYNHSLADIVLNKTQMTKILENNNHFIQTKDPIYMLPTHNFGRSHFYAPKKKVFDQYAGTLWFNVVVIWLGVLFLYVTLLYDALGRIINYFEKKKFKKLSFTRKIFS